MLTTASTERRGRSSAAADIVLKIPARLKHLVAPIENLIESVESRANQLGRDGRSVDYGSIERRYAELSAAIETAAHQCTLEAAVANEPQRVDVRGGTYTRVGEGVGTYKAMTGPVPVRRAIYRRLGERNGKTVDLISLRVGAIGDGWLPNTAQAMAHHLQSGTSREAAQSARQTCRLPYSRASFERVPHLVGGLWLEHHADIEDELIKAFEIPAQAASISVAIDRASVPMEEDVPRPPGRPRKNAPKRSVRRVFHMCYCATVTLHDKDGRALHTLRRGQMPGRDPQDLCNLLANDVLELREKRPDLLLALLADGAPEMWRLLESNFPASVFGHAHRCVDFWHVVEKLAAAAKVIAKNGDNARAMVWGWRHRLRRRKDAAETIRDELVASGCEELIVDGGRPVHDAITYLKNHAARMNYAGAIKKGLPIGSGNVEATCKTLVGLRMKRCGSRWHDDTGNHILHLRALAISDRWDDAMAKLFATQRTSVRTRAA
jgi:hypothetical protein